MIALKPLPEVTEPCGIGCRPEYAAPPGKYNGVRFNRDGIVAQKICDEHRDAAGFIWTAAYWGAVFNERGVMTCAIGLPLGKIGGTSK